MMTDPAAEAWSPTASTDPWPAWAARLLERPVAVQLGLWLLAILGLEGGSLLEPPVWDSAMGAFPPAIHLYESGFDIRSLLAEDGWWLGGPNVHSLSLFTWLVALVMTATESAVATFAIVHLVTFVGVAGSLVLFTRVLRLDGFAPGTVLAAAAFVLLMPLVLVQVGSLYTESWVMALGIAAWAAWREGRPGIATLLCVLALFVKLTAVALVGCLAAALLVSRRPSGIRRVLLLASLPAAYWLNRSLPGWLDARIFEGPRWGDARVLAEALVVRLGAIPDVTLLLAAALLGTVCHLRVLWRRGARPADLLGADWRTGARLIALAMPFAFSAGIIASLFSQTIFLPRYLVPIMPFCVVSILLWARTCGREGWVRIGLVLGSLIHLVNFDGLLYAPEHQSFSIVERSHAYRDFHRLQTDLIEALETVPEDLPVYVSKEIDYMVSHPMMGYVDDPLPQVRPIYRAPHRGRPIEELPEEFVLVFSNAGHGGEEMVRIVRAAQADPGREVRGLPFERDGFSGSMFWIRRSAPGSDATPGNARRRLKPSLPRADSGQEMSDSHRRILEEATLEVASIKDLDRDELVARLETFHLARIRALVSPEEVDHARSRMAARFSADDDHATTGESPSQVRRNFQKLSVGRARHGGVDRPRFMRCFYLPMWDEDVFGMREIFRKVAQVRNLLGGHDLDHAIDDPEAVAWTASRIHHFPTGGGFMVDHRDTVLPALYEESGLGSFYQPLVLLSQKGVDFEQGGGFARVGDERISYEDHSQKGDVVIYDTSTIHGVDDVDPHLPFRQDSLAGRMSGLVTMFKKLA